MEIKGVRVELIVFSGSARKLEPKERFSMPLRDIQQGFMSFAVR